MSAIPATSPSVPDLPLTDLHLRHHGVTQPVGDGYVEAASVCLSRHHEPPARITITCEGTADCDYAVSWVVPTPRTQRAHANFIEATEAGAYGVVLASLEARLGLVALTRAPQGSGSDYYVGPPGSEVNPDDGELDLEHAVRLEVSGTDQCNYLSDLVRLLREKVQQTEKGKSSMPAIAGVVGFSIRRVLFRGRFED